MKFKITPLDLDKREFGSWFAPFEREIMEINKNEHVGWVVHTGKNTFRLSYSPFSKHFRNYLDYPGAITYIAHSPELMPPEGKCVQVEGKIEKRPKYYGGSLWYEIYCHVETYSEYRIQRLKPDFDYKEFLYYCSIFWDFAGEDNLDDMIALNLLSCPTSFYGYGGLGSISANLTPRGNLSKKYPSQLRVTFKSIVPQNFTIPGKNYSFRLLTEASSKTIKNNIKTTFGHNIEMNFSTPCATKGQITKMSSHLPYQLPIIVRYSEYNSENKDLAEPYIILQYLLSAQLLYPNYNENKHLELIKKNVKEVNKTWTVRDTVRIDPHTVNKLALGMSRLYMEDTFKKKRATEALEFIKEQLNDWVYYSEETGNLGSLRKDTRSFTTIRDNLTRTEIGIIIKMKQIHDEEGFTWIDSKRIRNMYFKKIPEDVFRDHLINLSNSTLIIQKNNFELVRLTYREGIPEDML